MLDKRKSTVINYRKRIDNHWAISWAEYFSDEYRSNPKLHKFFFLLGALWLVLKVQPILPTNQRQSYNLSWPGHMRFPTFQVVSSFFFSVSYWLPEKFPILWLAAVVSLVLPPSHSIKMCSEWIEINQLITRPPIDGMWVCRATYHLITCHVQPPDWLIRTKWNGDQLIDILISQQLSITSFLASPGSLLWKFNGALIAKNPFKKT